MKRLIAVALLILAAVTISVTDGNTAPAQSGTRLDWQGSRFWSPGANMPWIAWNWDGTGANDFGSATQGVAANPARTDAFLNQAANAGLQTVRWWMFQGDAARLLLANGVPAQVYTDIDAALVLARRYDLYFQFTLFTCETLPSSWLSTERAAFVSRITPLFQRYGNEPRIHTWEVCNEPEWAVWDGRVNQTNLVATAASIASAIHQSGTAMVTTCSAMLDGLSMWTGAGFDYYCANWYPYMSSGNWCARCRTYADVNTWAGLGGKPLVIGEFYADGSTAAGDWNWWYDQGYAGARAWSLNPAGTNDKLAINYTVAKAFTDSKTDDRIIVGSTPTPSPSQTPTPSPTVTATSSPSPTPTPTATTTPSPTPSPTASPSPTPTPAPNLCRVQERVGSRWVTRFTGLYINGVCQ